VISWKNSFKRLNEEYELAKKKKQAVDNLYITGKISQITRDSFNKDISSAIAEIERQQKDFVEKMQLKTEELTSQIKLLETLLANYEIQYVVGEIGEETYQRDISLFTLGIDTAKNELEILIQATTQLCGTVPTIQAPVAPDMPVVEPVIVTPAPTEAAVASVEISMPIETPVESATIETTSFEAASTPIEEPIMEAAIFAPVEESVMESAIVADAPIEETLIEESVMESAIVADAPVEEPVMEAPMDVSGTPVEEVTQFVSVETDDSAIEITATEPVFLTAEAVIEEPVMELAMDADETLLETAVMDLPVEEATIDLVEEQTIADVADVPLQVFEVTEQAPVEQTLEKVMEQLNSPAVEALAVEELTHDSHPSTAPHQAPSEITAEAVSDGQIDESDADTTE
jgi:hypothetical protein